MIKKKIKKWLLSILIANLPWILIAVIILSGISAVSAFFKGIFKWGNNQNIDINNCTIEQLITAAKDKRIFTKKVLKDMMIDRNTIVTLLKTVNDYNNRDESKVILVDINYYYTYSDPVEINGKQEWIEKSESGIRSTEVTVSNNDLISSYDLDWQTVYIFCLFKSMGNYKNWTLGSSYDEYGNAVEPEKITLTKADILNAIELIKPKFTYLYDAVNNAKTNYSQYDVMKVPNQPISFTKYIDGYNWKFNGSIPISVLKKVDGSYFTDVLNINSDNHVTDITTYSKEERFISLGKQFYKYFTLELFYDLLKKLPGGVNVANKYRSLFDQGSGDFMDDLPDGGNTVPDIGNGNSPIGNSIVSFALQFEGNPYVWGGTSLTHGCDCSGFAQQVYAHFGYSLPRTSREQAARGKPVNLNSIQPGDLLFYVNSEGTINHVSIYIGNQKIIAAANERLGIRISRYNNRPPVKAVRYY